MGRVERRRQERQEKKLKSKGEKEYIPNNNSVKTLIITGLSIVVVLILLYFIVAIFITKEIDVGSKKTSSETSSASDSSVSNKILANSIFNQKEDTYYVYFYDFTDEDSDIGQIINSINEPVYRVDSSSGLNSKYIDSDNSNKNAKNLEELKVKSPTLIKIENDTITKYFEGNEILNYNK